MQLIHLPSAHTDGDLFVKWHHANVILAADFFVPEEDLAFVDTEGGGNFGGFINAVSAIIDLCDEQTRIIPGHHRTIARRDDLIQFRQVLIAIERLAAQPFDAGVALADVDGAALYREHYRGGLFQPGPFIEMMYDRLSRRRSMSNPTGP